MQSMSCYIRHIGDIAIAGGNQIDQIATDALTGQGEPVDLIERSNAVNQWHECLLDAVGQLEFILHADGFGGLFANESNEIDVREDE